MGRGGRQGHRPHGELRKWAVVDAKDIARTESWLEDMAAQGLFFHSFSRWSILAPGPLWVVLFQVDVPKPRRRYRLCPARPQEAEPTQETLELYAQSGWQFLRYWGTSCVSYYLFYTDDPNALEPYTDPDSLYEALRPPKKDLVNDLFLGAFFMATGRSRLADHRPVGPGPGGKRPGLAHRPGPAAEHPGHRHGAPLPAVPPVGRRMAALHPRLPGPDGVPGDGPADVPPAGPHGPEPAPGAVRPRL